MEGMRCVQGPPRSATSSARPTLPRRAARRRPGRAALALWAALLVPTLASAGLASAATSTLDLIDTGAFEAAYEQASTSSDADQLTLAAQAASDQAVYVLSDHDAQLTWLGRARDAAQRALDAGPPSAAAYVQLARAKGEIAQRTGVMQNLGTAGELKDLFEKALKLDPNDADALVGFALWNLELTQRGVGWLYGASADRVLPMLEKGVAARPEQVNLHVEYARALRTLGRDAQANEELRRALALPGRTAVDRYEQQRARSLLGR